jgi:tRNA G18 (ribose-2'-O)-methylase SpoU
MTTPLQRNDLPPLVGVLENIRSLWNVGSIFRSADGAGLERLLLCGYTPHPPRKEISKTALGAEDFVPWEYWSSAADACHSLSADGYEIVALETGSQSADLIDLPWTGKTAFVVGNEVVGIHPDTLAVCDRRGRLPMLGHKDSLNVAVAFGIAAYSMRRRGLSPHPVGESAGRDT